MVIFFKYFTIQPKKIDNKIIEVQIQNEAKKSKSGDDDFFLLTNQICLYVGVALENEILYTILPFLQNRG